MYNGASIQAIATQGPAEALESASILLSNAGMETGVCRFHPSGVAEWGLNVPAQELPAVGALLVRAGIQLTRSGQALFATMCQYALHSAKLPAALLVQPLFLTIELHSATPTFAFDDRAMQLPLPA